MTFQQKFSREIHLSAANLTAENISDDLTAENVSVDSTNREKIAYTLIQLLRLCHLWRWLCATKNNGAASMMYLAQVFLFGNQKHSMSTGSLTPRI